MRRNANASPLLAAGLSLLLGVASIVSFQPHAASQPSLRLVVIANPSVPDKVLDMDALRMIFFGLFMTIGGAEFACVELLKM